MTRGIKSFVKSSRAQAIIIDLSLVVYRNTSFHCALFLSTRHSCIENRVMCCTIIMLHIPVDASRYPLNYGFLLEVIAAKTIHLY